MIRSSYSQHELFGACPRLWYYQYVLKLSVESDMSYADAGKIVHECLEMYYKNKLPIEDIKTAFKVKWKNKKLDNSIVKDKEDGYWLMCVEGINKNLSITSVEFTIIYDEIVGHLDLIDTNTDTIHDWKSSTRGEDNEQQYRRQLILYSWLYYRKFQRLPKKCVVHYLKHNGSKGEYEFTPTMEDLFNIEDWYFKLLKEMEKVKLEGKTPERCEVCYHFCPDAIKNMCEQNTEGQLSLILNIIGNYIHVEGPVTPLLHKGIEKKFSYTLKDAFFIKKRIEEKLGHPSNFDGKVKFWNINKQLLPIGFYKELLITLNDYAVYKKLDLQLSVKDKRAEYKKTLTMPEKFINDVILRDYQITAADEFLRQKIAILEVGTGGGKTEIAIECIRRLGCKTLFIVDKIELLNQTKKRIENSLGIEVGEIGAGEDNIKDVTVATVQTLIKNLHKYSKYLQSITFAIFDETHKVAARSYAHIANHLVNTIYRLGISGTAYRDDGEDMWINSIVGYKCFDLSAKTLIENGWLMRPQIKFIKITLDNKTMQEKENKVKTGLINETEHYGDYYKEFISENEFRNLKIFDIINKNRNKKILVLTKLINHGDMLATLLEGKHLYGNTTKEDRKAMLKEFEEGKTKILISTISIFSEGIDLPHLDIVINAAANRGDVKSIQTLGRVLRKKEGKENAQYFDFIDVTKFFDRASRARVKAFRKEGHEVEIINEL